jgi:quinol monooxygenase YgiN
MLHTVTYVDIEPNSASHAISLLKRYQQTTSREAGNSTVLLLQESSRRNRFVIVETWSDEQPFESHESAPQTAEFRSELRKIHNSPYDQRVHHTFAIGPERQDDAGVLYIVTHVDVPPPRKDETEVLLTVQSAQSRTDTGNIRFDVFQQNAPRTNHFSVVATWKDEAAFLAHQAASHTRKFREELGPKLGAPYDERLFTRLA